MTTYFEDELLCGVCGATAKVTELSSSNTRGYGDLDTRPPEMMRSTIGAWVQSCPECGYCADNLAKATKAAREVVADERYQVQLKSDEFPELARRFLCKAMVLYRERKRPAAAWAAVHAAWACDDAEDLEAASRCRRKAVELIRKARRYDRFTTDRPGGDQLVELDLLRRAGDHDGAQAVLDGLELGAYDELIRQLFVFSQELIANQDTGCYTVGAALGEEEY